MKKWLMTSVCLFSLLCFSQVINASNVMDKGSREHLFQLRESEQAEKEYLSQLNEYERACEESNVKSKKLNELYSKFKAEIDATRDDELIKAFQYGSQRFVFRNFVCPLSDLKDLKDYESSETSKNTEVEHWFEKIETERDNLLNKYIPKFEEVLSNDPIWKFIKEKTNIPDPSLRFDAFQNQYEYEPENYICPFEFLKFNTQLRNTFNNMYQEFAAWTDGIFKQLENDNEFCEKLKLDETDLEALKINSWYNVVPCITSATFRIKSGVNPTVNENLNGLLEKYGDLKKRVEDLAKLHEDTILTNHQKEAAAQIMDSYLSKYEALLQFDDEILEQAIYDSSRAPTIQEMKNMKHLLSIIAKKHGISEVRILDAKSLISSMNLQTKEKNKLLSLLVSADQAEIDAEIQKFLDESKFFDIYSHTKKSNIRHDVRNALFGGSRYSPVYRDQILALIAWSRAEAPALYEIYCATPFALNYCRSINFKAEAGVPHAYRNNIYMNFAINKYEHWISENERSNVVLSHAPTKMALFHEIGHVISGKIGNFIDLRCCAKQSMDIAAESIVTQRDNAAIAENMALLRSLSPDKLTRLWTDFKLGFEERKVCGLRLDLSDDESLLKFFEEYFASESLCFHLCYAHDTIELMQIMGLFSHQHEGKRILYINALSDAAASAFAHCPIRVDHCGTAVFDTPQEEHRVSKSVENAEQSAENTKQSVEDIWEKLKPTIMITKVNLNFYRALVSAFGVNAKDYFSSIKTYDPYSDCWIIPTKTLTQALKSDCTLFIASEKYAIVPLRSSWFYQINAKI